MTETWLRWQEHPWLSGTDPTVLSAQLCERIVQVASDAKKQISFAQTILPEIAAEFSAQWIGVVDRTTDWKTIVEHGRHSLSELPRAFLAECLDRDSAGRTEVSDVANWSVVAVPLDSDGTAGHLLVLVGRNLTDEDLPAVSIVARAFGYGLAFSHQFEAEQKRSNRLERTLQIASNLAAVHETEPLLEKIAEEATNLLDCDRASIFIWDREHHEVVACPALGVEDGTLRLADDVGIVGTVIQSRETIRVDDAYKDSRFDNSVDDASGYTTRNLLCVPLLDSRSKLIGAFEAINKNEGLFNDEDADSLSQLGVQAATALANTREREQLTRSREQLAEQVTRHIRVIGESPAIVALRSTIERLAGTDLPVLVLGESGTGKEVVSQSLHYQGPRADQPFIAVNCAALTETLLESELFGHEKGAFTDARETRRGKFELADGGTLFLDEIGDMSLGGQAKLLRVLEQKVVTRVGGSQPIPINVRVIAATNAKLAESVQNKNFREDLFYRLSVVTLDLPPLRERPEDILPLAEYFLEQFSRHAGRPKLKLSAEARNRLQAHGWPGNVRELRNLMERVSFLTSGDRVQADDLAFILSPERESSIDLSGDLGLGEATKRFQQEYIRRSIRRVRGNMSEAAKLLGLHRSNLYRKMRQLDMHDEAGEEE